FGSTTNITQQQDTKPLLNDYRQGGVLLKHVAVMPGQTVDEGGGCQQAKKHLTLEETGKDSLPVSAISDHNLKSMEEIPGDRPLQKESWIWPEKGINPAGGSVPAPLCEEEQEEHCKSPTK
ncbi:unnamed protein product, partial [Pleuronectes platessa]